MTHEFESLRPALAYLPADEVGTIEDAYEFSRRAHEGQFRKSGEPYISHPLAVAGILAGWHLDAQTLCAALLHDVVEDTPATASEIEARFGKPVALLVEGVSKLDKLAFASEQHAQAENFRKMLLAMAQDVRVILVKLADRLHNMHTMGAMPAEKRRRIATETLEIYAPIANRLGLHSVYQELEDLGFRYSHPNRYQVLSKAVKAARGNRRELVDKVKIALQDKLEQCKIEATITGREKHLYSIYRKMQEKNLAFSEVFDIYGFRVVVRDQPTCYLALGALHSLYKPIPGKFKDYIAIPKANGYQSLHSILFGPNGTPIEIQIRTTDMNRLAESGVASHWMYKSADAALNDVQTRTHRWLQSLLDIQADHGDSPEFLEHIKVDLFPDEVYVFTPKGKIMALPRGVTGKARSHIRNYLRNTRVEEAAALGERLLNHAIAALNPEATAPDPAVWERVVKDYGLQNRQELFAGIGLGRKLPLVVAHQLLHVQGEKTGEPAHPHAISIRGTEGIAVELAQCCHPIPGDPILGFIHKERGLIIHTHDCPSIRAFRTDPDKWLDVEWEAEPGHMFDVSIKVVVGNQRGVLAKVAAAIAEHGSNIGNVAMEEEDGSPYTVLFFTVQVENRMHLARVMRGLRVLPDVVRIFRIKGKKDGRAAQSQ